MSVSLRLSRNRKSWCHHFSHAFGRSRHGVDRTVIAGAHIRP